MTHNPQCSGCPECNSELAAVLKMNAEQYTSWLRISQARHAAALGIRTAVHVAADDTNEQLERMQEFRGQVYQMAQTAGLGLPPATSKVHLEPPDPYQPHLDARRKDAR